MFSTASNCKFLHDYKRQVRGAYGVFGCFIATALIGCVPGTFIVWSASTGCETKAIEGICKNAVERRVDEDQRASSLNLLDDLSKQISGTSK